MEYYSVVKKKKKKKKEILLLLFVTEWMDLEIIMLSGKGKFLVAMGCIYHCRTPSTIEEISAQALFLFRHSLIFVVELW